MEYVTITEEDASYRVHNPENQIIFSCIKVNEIMYVNCDVLNVRTIPSTDSNRWNYLLRDTKVRVVGKSCGWDIIAIGLEKFFVWDSYLTSAEPENPIEVIELEEEIIVVTESAVPASEIAPPPVPVTVEAAPPPAPVAPARQYLGNFRVTFYSAEQMHNSGSANGFGSIPWVTCAAGYDIPFGTHLYVEGLGEFEVRDRGVPSGCIDIFVSYNLEIPGWGLAYLPTYLVYWGDGRTAWGHE